MKAPEEIETARLILRRPAMSDAAAIFDAYAADPEVTRFLGWPRHRSIRDTRDFLRFSAREWERWPAGPYLIVSRADGRLLGSTGLGFQAPHEAMTGYVLARDAWGHGYATEAAGAVLRWAFETLDLNRVQAETDTRNLASARVLEKLGFVREGTLREDCVVGGEVSDSWVFGLLRREWR